MFCSSCRRQQIPYESRELSAGRLAAVARHLERCPRCQETYREGKRLRRLLSPAPVVGSRRDLWAGVAGRVAGRQPRPRPVLERAWRPAVGLAVLATAAALIINCLGPSEPGASGRGTWLESAVTLETPRQVHEDPWAGDVTRALDSALSQEDA